MVIVFPNSATTPVGRPNNRNNNTRWWKIVVKVPFFFVVVLMLVMVVALSIVVVSGRTAAAATTTFDTSARQLLLFNDPHYNHNGAGRKSLNGNYLLPYNVCCCCCSQPSSLLFHHPTTTARRINTAHHHHQSDQRGCRALHMVLLRRHNYHPATTAAAVLMGMRGGAAGLEIEDDIGDPIQQQQILDPESDDFDDMTSLPPSSGNMFLGRGRTRRSVDDTTVSDDKTTSTPQRVVQLISLQEDNHRGTRRRRTTPQQGGSSTSTTTTTEGSSNNNDADQRTDPAAFVVVGKQTNHQRSTGSSMPWKYTPEQLRSRLQQQQQQQQQMYHIPPHGNNNNNGDQPSSLRTVGNTNDDNYLQTALYPSLQPRNALWRILTSIFASLFGWFHRSTATTTSPASVAELHINNINVVVHPQLTSLVQLYAWSLVGSSVGFYSFLYFISVGHALGIFFPVGATLTRYVHRCITTKTTTFSLASVVHSMMVLAWAIRLCVFLLWREYSSWPALHFKILQVQALLPHKFVCWFLYSLVYVCMMSPCWFRLEADLLLTTATPSVLSWLKKATSTILTVTGIVGQFLGLTIESIADYQKSQFKAVPGQRNAWCHTGLWQYSTHPNYAGEWIFWIGTIVAALPSIVQLSMGSTIASKTSLLGVLHLLLRGGVAGIGFVFLTTILSGAIQLQQQRQQAKYGSDPFYCDFIARTGVFGPFRQRQRFDLDDNEAQTTNTLTMEDSPLLLAENADDVAT